MNLLRIDHNLVAGHELTLYVRYIYCSRPENFQLTVSTQMKINSGMIPVESWILGRRMAQAKAAKGLMDKTWKVLARFDHAVRGSLSEGGLQKYLGSSRCVRILLSKSKSGIFPV